MMCLKTMADMLHDNNKDALPKCIRNFRKLLVKHWHNMEGADLEVVMRSIHNPACIYLCQHVTKCGVDVVILEEEPPSGWDFNQETPREEKETRGIGADNQDFQPCL